MKSIKKSISSEHALTHQDVLKEVNKSKNIFTNLLLDLIKLIQL